MALSALDPALVLCTLLLTVVTLVTWEVFFSPLSAFPGPFAAKFTDFFRSYLVTLGDVDIRMRRWHDAWGSAVRVGPNAISLNDPSLIKVLYTTKNPWRKSSMYRPNDILVHGERIPNIFNVQDKDFHAKLSRPIRGFWTLGKLLELEPYMDETLQQLLNALGSRFADGENAGKICIMDDWIPYYSWDSSGNVTFAKHYGMIERGQDVDGFRTESKAALKYFAAVSQVPWLDNWLDKNPVKRIGPRPLVKALLFTLDNLTKHASALSEGTHIPHDPPVFLDLYTQLGKTYPNIADEKQILNWLMLNVLAGGDSTAGAMVGTVYALLKNPGKAQKLHEELDEANVSLPARWKDISKLPYLDAVIRESQRLYPSLGLMLEREVPKDGLTLPDGRYIPEGTKVGINPSVVNMDIRVFGDDVVAFRPERWFRKEGEDDQCFAHRLRRMQETADFMFGAGSRVCMGKYFAKMEMYKLIATLYSAFDLKLVNPDHEWKYDNSWFMYHHDIPTVISRRRGLDMKTRI